MADTCKHAGSCASTMGRCYRAIEIVLIRKISFVPMDSGGTNAQDKARGQKLDRRNTKFL